MEGEERVEFKPIPARDLLVEILSTSELMIDLAYASALFNDEDLAQNVVELSEKVDRLCHQLAMIIAIAARDKEDAEAMLGLWVLASNSDKMSDAATDVAYTVLRGLGIPRIASEAFEEVEERIGRYNLNENSILVGKTPKELALEGKIGVDIIALRRGEEWIFNPSDVVLAPKDLLLVRGDRESLSAFRSIASGELNEFKVPQLPPLREEEAKTPEEKLGSMLADLVDLAKLSVDLAHSSFLYFNPDIAREVEKLELLVDLLHTDLELEAIKTGREKGIPEKKVLGLLRLALAAENITDAARSIAEVVLGGVRPHPIVEQVMRETADTVFMVEVKEGSKVTGLSLGDLNLEEMGLRIIAVKRGERWIYKPTPSFVLKEGDIVVVSGYKEGRENFEKMVFSKIKEA
ncbi:MAG: hypothetical protein DRO00_08175 [Thermoproteota archaeon]|nr:MAG: hypothetical protein DRO00_08175 [Candidatus Korarchaeota archaeon]